MSNDLFKDLLPDDSAFAGLFGQASPRDSFDHRTDSMLCGLNALFGEGEVQPPRRYGRSEVEVALDTVLALKENQRFASEFFDQNHIEAPFDVDGNYTHYTRAAPPTKFDMAGKPLTPVELGRLFQSLPAPPEPIEMTQKQFDSLRPHLNEAPNDETIPFGAVEVRIKEQYPIEKIELPPLKYQSLSKWEPSSDFFANHSPSMAELGLMSSYRPCAPVISRPGLYMAPIQIPPCPVTTRKLRKLRHLRAKFRYWYGRMQRLERDGYIQRLGIEGPSVCYHGATGDNQRFAKWRMAFHEAVALSDKIDALENG